MTSNFMRKTSPGVAKVNEPTGVPPQRLVAVVVLLGGPAVPAVPVDPGVPEPFVVDVALGPVEPHDRVPAVGILGAVEAPAREQARELGDGDAEDLPLVDVVEPLLQVGLLALKALDEPLGDLAQEHTRLARWVLHLCLLRKRVYSLRQCPPEILFPFLLYRGTLRKEGCDMTLEQFEAEKNYQAARQIAESFRQQGLLTDEEFGQIDTILLEKWEPSLGVLFSEITCYSEASE